MPRTCIFCDSPAGNAEHVVAEWLSTAMERRDEGFVAAVRRGDDLTQQRPPILLQSFTLKKVCRDCNNGWMSNLESRFQSEFSHLVVPRSFDDAVTVKTLLGSHNELLVRWLLKSAVVAQHAMPSGEEQVIPTELFDAQNIDIDGYGFNILAAEIRDSGFAVRLRKGYRTYNGGTYHEDQIHEQGFNFSIQLNHLALMIVNCPNAYIGALSPYSEAGFPVMPMVPASEVNWGMPVKHLFRCFNDFVDSLEVYATTS